VEWDPSPSAVLGYHVLVGVAPQNPAQYVDAGLTLSWALDLPAGQTYYISVRSYNATAVGAPSPEITYTPPATAPVDCVVSAWSSWTPTTDWGVCYLGQQAREETRWRTVLTPPANGGVACPVLSETRTVYQPCLNVCEASPLMVTVTKWPVNPGGKGLQYSSSHAIASYAVTTTKKQVTGIKFTDVRSCVATVTK
jgi:hypothetical protein